MATEAQCDSCGETNAAGSSFCLYCGAYLGWDQPGAGPSGAPAPAPTPTTPTPTPATPAAPAPPPPTPAPTPTAPLPPVPPTPRPQTAQGNACPSCGHPNDAGRRFCARCGYALVAAARPAHPAPAARQSSSGWWPWSGGSEERAAKRAYRRSLPPLYRWRRVLIALLVLVLGIALIAVLQGNPVEWGKQRYYDILDKKVAVEGTDVFVEPGNQPTEDVTDDDPSTFWGMPWPAGTAATDDCAATPQRLRIEWSEAVRVRGLKVAPGRREQDQARALSPRPRTLLVSWEEAGGELACEEVTLPDDAAALDVDVDTVTEVTTLWLTIGDVYPAKNATEERPVAIRAVQVLRRP